jgi:hypothetical protein
MPSQTAVTESKVAIDPIDRLIAELSATCGMWRNGIFPVLGLPQTATPEEVIRRLFSMGLPRGETANYKIREIRQVHIAGVGSDSYTAALVQKDSAMKIVLIQYAGRDWWTHVYDTKPSA